MSPLPAPGDDLEVSTADTADVLADATATVVDVREDHEREAGHIGGTLHIPLGALSERAGEIPSDKPVVFYCYSGGRSMMAAQALQASGADARSMAGGITAWHGEGRPLEPDGGRVEH